MLLQSLFYLVVVIFLYVLPGWVLLSLLWKGAPLSGWEKVGISAGLSFALYPILFLWFYVMGLSPGPYLAWGLSSLSLMTFLWINRNKLRFSPDWKNRLKYWILQKDRLFDVFMLVLLGAILFSRLSVIQGMVAPAWGDSVHHTFIVQLFRDHGGLFQSWAPYAPMESFTYHFGFHSGTAVWAWITGQSSPQAVLVAGQVFNFLAVMTLYPLVVRLCGSRMAGLVALIFAGLLFPFPGYYTNWGRYTQLAGQIILPPAIWFFDMVWTKEKNRNIGFFVLIFILLQGLALTHYRVVLVGIAAAAAWMLWGIWTMREHIMDWLKQTLKFGATALASLLAIVPWLFVVTRGRLLTFYNLSENSSEKSFLSQDFSVWKNTGVYFNNWFLILGAIAFVLIFIFRRRLAFPLMGWCLLSFLIANPFLLGLLGSVWLENAILVYGIYIPLGIVFGWFLGNLLKKIGKRPAAIVFVGIILCFFLVVGIRFQLKLIDPFFQMVTTSDQLAFKWIRKNTPRDAKFLVNGFLAYDEKLVVGSDAGWWLPFYTQRYGSIPPINYFQEKMPLEISDESLVEIVKSVKNSGGESSALRETLCRFGITHVYLGDRRGKVGYGDTELIPESWLRGNSDFTLIHQEKKAQVWRFNYIENCDFERLPE